MRKSLESPGDVAFTRFLGSFPRYQSGNWALVGQDGGQSISLGEESLFVFADTLLALERPAKDGQRHRVPFFFGAPPAAGRPDPGQSDGRLYFLANCALVTTTGRGETRPTLCQALAGGRYLGGDEGMPGEILAATAEERAEAIRFWPAHGIFTGGQVYLYYLGIRQGKPDSMWDFANAGVGLAVLDPATGACRRLRRNGEWRFWQPAGDDLHYGVQVLRQGDELFVFGSRRYGLELEAILGRVAIAQLDDPGAYRYFRPATGEWIGELSQAGGLGACGSDYSVSYNPYLGRYLMVYVDSFDKSLWQRTAEAIHGPYSRPRRIGRVPHQPTTDLVYLAFEHPQFAAGDGRRIAISYCQPYFVPNGVVEVCFA
jgi:hypothetical protein